MAGNAPDDEARIRELAYFLWKDAGSPEGMAGAHWEQACRILFGQSSGGEPLELQAAAAAKAEEEAKTVAAKIRRPRVASAAAAAGVTTGSRKAAVKTEKSTKKPKAKV
ncbi:DUF2934 domain-containing protein [Roseomonas gilardii subsp. gilardii]|uniref:DUF2934 domain-containing protein n=1 Tax=Roseomonas gilardii TaxID=257708 RepID=UPI001FF889C6|nr:DUF2934 domain-containing protein [Roseomonas gilardii]UPG71617.1 DUF2934 domain-containing protein [Roseomonas gilardii subsp. gilardii]